MDVKTPKKSVVTQAWIRLRAWVVSHKKLSVAIALFVAALLGGIVYAILLAQPAPEAPSAPPEKAKPKPAAVQKFYSPLTGIEVADEAATKANVTAVMIENSPDARPQSGLKQADVVYEAIAEGGITRFVALYQQERPELVGPVRSLRMYYLDWIAPYDASIAHVGGSLFSLQEVRNGTHKDIDQFHNPDTYWRASDRYAPHNVYTSFGHLDELNTARGYNESAPVPIARQDAMPAGGAANAIQVSMSSPTFDSAWNYDGASASYHRLQGGAPHVDREQGQITADVVVVLKAQMDKVMEDGWRESYHTSGTGDAVVFAGGMAHEVIWHKENMRTQLFFTNKTDGKAFELPRGKTWFSAVPTNGVGGVTWQ